MAQQRPNTTDAPQRPLEGEPTSFADRLGHARAFLRALMHDHRQSVWSLSARTAQGWSSCVQAVRPGALEEVVAPAAGAGADWFVTRCGFTRKSVDQQDLRVVTGLFADLDVAALHSGEVDPKGEEAAALRARAVDEVLRSVDSGALPEPTMVVDTGRGVQLHYVFDRSAAARLSGGEPNDRLLGLVSTLQGRLDALLDTVLDGSCLSRDGAVGNYNRVVRLPGSVNTSSGTVVRLVGAPGRCWPYAELLSALPAAPAPRGAASSAPGPARVVALDKLNIRRMAEARQLRDFRDYAPEGKGCVGSRNELMWFFMNAAAAVHGLDEAYRLALDFNDGFKVPLPARELRATRSTLEHVGHYRLSAEAVVEHLSIDEDEMRLLSFGAGAKEIKRAAARARTAQRRRERDEAVLRALGRGLTRAEAAEEAGCSLRTVANVISRAKAAEERRARVAAPAPVEATVERFWARVQKIVRHTYCEKPGSLPVAQRPVLGGCPGPFLLPLMPPAQTHRMAKAMSGSTWPPGAGGLTRTDDRRNIEMPDGMDSKHSVVYNAMYSNGINRRS